MSQPCENIDGQCGASWCDCDYQRRKRAGSFAAPSGYAAGDYAINRHTNRMCKILRADADGGCVLDTNHGPLYHSATLMDEHWKPHNDPSSATAGRKAPHAD